MGILIEFSDAFCCVSDPFMLPRMQVDKGAIKFVLSGANIMCPGLTSPGAKMTRVPKGTVVVSFLCTDALHLSLFEFLCTVAICICLLLQ